MGEEDVSTELAENELGEVSGGVEYIVRKEDRSFEYWYRCTACGEYKELLYSRRGRVSVPIVGTFTCPKCGFTTEFSIHIG